MSPQCIVIGASAGGLKPLREVISRLQAGFSVPFSSLCMYLLSKEPPTRDIELVWTSSGSASRR